MINEIAEDMSRSLVDKAKNTEPRTLFKDDITPEHVDLAVAWTKNEINSKQFTSALGSEANSGNYAYKAAIFIRQGVLKGWISIIKKGTPL